MLEKLHSMNTVLLQAVTKNGKAREGFEKYVKQLPSGNQ